MAQQDPIGETISVTNQWLNEIEERLATDNRHRSFQVLRAVLQALRDRLGNEIGAHLAAQLPMLVRGLYYEGYDPTHAFARMTLEDFLNRVEAHASLKGRSEAEEAVRAVAEVLWDHVSDGMMQHIMAVLPSEYAEVF